MLNIHLQEHRTRWTSPAPIEAALEILDGSAWGRLCEMSVDLCTTWHAYDRLEAVTEVWAHTGVNLRWQRGVEASIARNPVNNTIGLYLSPAAFEQLGAGALEALLARLAGALPTFGWARAVADLGAALPLFRGMAPPPPPFVHAAWLQLIHPRAYTPIVEREVLLATPAARVDERADGTIWIRTYDRPFHYEAPLAVDQIRAVSAHLARHVRTFAGPALTRLSTLAP